MSCLYMRINDFCPITLKPKISPIRRLGFFYSQDEAGLFLKNSNFPIVAKTNIGASGSGVEILKTKEAAFRYIEDAFSCKGITRSFLPQFQERGLYKKV